MYNEHPTTFAPVEYHPTWGLATGEDPFETLEADARASYYGIYMTPTAVFDGIVTTQPYTTWEAIYNSRRAVASPLDIKLRITNSGDNFNLVATIKRNGSMNGTGLRFHVAVTESKIHYGNGEYNHVLRKMYPSAAGTSFTINEGQQKELTIPGTLNPSWVKTNLRFVVWVQHYDSKAVYQAKVATWSQISVEPESLGRLKVLFK